VTGHDTLEGSGKLLNQAIEMGREASAVTLVGQVICMEMTFAREVCRRRDRNWRAPTISRSFRRE